jgi:hypothetical protein
MAWAYCDKCEERLYVPTNREVLGIDEYRCGCGHINPVRKTKEDLILELFDEIDSLKQKVYDL